MVELCAEFKDIKHNYNDETSHTIVITNVLSSVRLKGTSSSANAQTNLLSTLVEIQQLGDNIIKLEDNFCKDCVNLFAVKTNDSVLSVGNNAFDGCTSLTTIDLLEEKNTSRIKSFGNNAFSNTRIASAKLKFSNDVSIGSNVFADCTQLTSVAFTGPTQLGNNMFSGCSELKEVQLADPVKKVGNKSFFNCTRLTSINLPASLPYVSEGMFQGCTSLQTVQFDDGLRTPVQLQRINDNAFNGCTSLTSIVFPPSITNPSTQLALQSLHDTNFSSITFTGVEESTVLSGNMKTIKWPLESDWIKTNNSVFIDFKSSAFKQIYQAYGIKKAKDAAISAIVDVYNANIPIIVLHCDGTGDCPLCNDLKSRWYGTQEFSDAVNSQSESDRLSKCFYIQIYGGLKSILKEVGEQCQTDFVNSQSWQYYPELLIAWKGNTFKQTYNSSETDRKLGNYTTNDFISDCDKVFPTYKYSEVMQGDQNLSWSPANHGFTKSSLSVTLKSGNTYIWTKT